MRLIASAALAAAVLSASLSSSAQEAPPTRKEQPKRIEYRALARERAADTFLWSSAGTVVVGALIGGYVHIRAYYGDEAHRLERRCVFGDEPECDRVERMQENADSAVVPIAAISTGVALALFGTGTYLLFAKTKKEPRVSASVASTDGGAFAVIRGAF